MSREEYTERISLSEAKYSEYWGKEWTMQLDDVYSVPGVGIESGGAIATGNSNVTLKTAAGDGIVYFLGNRLSKGNGGAIHIQGGTNHEIKNAVFDGNQAALGGAVYNLADQLLTIENSLFQNNISTQSGALASEKESLVVNTIFRDNKSTGAAGTKTYDSGALYVFDGGKVTVKDCYFSGNTGADSRCGAIANKQATLVFQGENILATASDTIFAWQGNIIFDISDKTTPESASEAVLNHFDYINVYSTNVSGSDLTTFKVNVSSNQRNDIYVIANDASKAGTNGYGSGTGNDNFKLTIDNANETKIVVGGEAVEQGKYALKKTAANDLVLVVGGNFLFVNNEYPSWDQEEWRLAVYRGVEFWGVEDDRSHFIAFQDAVDRGLEQGMKDNCKLVGVDEGDVNYSVELKGVTSDLTSGNFKRLVVGGAVDTAVTTTSGTNLMISGGTYNSNVIGSDYASGGNTLVESKASTLEITGGTFEKAIAGGMYAYTGNAGTKATLNVGEGNTAVNLVISGGEFNGRIYGGNYATDDTSAKATNSNIIGDISITIDCNKSAIQINDGITVGSRGKGKILGNTTLTFTGNGDNLKFGGESEVADIWGGSNRDTRLFKSDKWVRNSSSVSGHSALVFDNFKDGSFEATFGLFTDIKATKGSKVTFANDALDTSDVENWLIEAGCSLAGLQKNDFEGDTLALYGVAGETLISGTKDSFANLDKAASVLINGKECSYAEGCWASSEIGLKLVIDDNTNLKLASLA